MLITREYDSWSTGLSGSELGDQGPSAAMVSYGTTGFAFASNVITNLSRYDLDDSSVNGLGDWESDTCEFGIYTTLSICAKCINISHSITTDSGRIVLPQNRLSLDIQGGFVNITSDTEYPEPSRFDENTIGPLIVHYLALGHDANATEGAPIAVECVAFWCAATYESYVNDGLLYEYAAFSETDPDSSYINQNAWTNTSDTAKTFYNQTQDIFLRPESCYSDNMTVYDVETCTHHITANAQLGLQNFLSEGYFNIPPLLRGSEESAGNNGGWRTTSFAANAISSACPVNGTDCPAHLTTSLTSSFVNMTKWMSNVVRKSVDENAGQLRVIGKEFRTERV